MSNKEHKIELYKRRTWSQSLMAGIDFYQQHIKIIYGNVFKIGLPTAILSALIFSNGYGDSHETSFSALAFSSASVTRQIIYSIVLLIAQSLTFTVIAYLLQLYDEGQIKSPRKFQLMENLMSRSGKTLAIYFFVSLLYLLAGYALIKLIEIENLYAVFLLIGIIIFLTPLLTLVTYPACFEECSAFESLSKGIRMGFRSWGSTFMIAFIVSMILLVMFYAFFFIGFIISLLGVGLMAQFTIFFLVMDIFLIFPIFVICFAFHYFSIQETNEGISLKAKIDDFENL